MPPQFEEAKLTEEDFKKEIPNITPQSRFANNAVNDKWAAILFIAHLFVTLAYAASGIIYNTVAGNDLSIFPGDHDLILIIGLLSVSVLVGIAAALFFYFFTLKKPLLLIQVSMVIYVGFFFAYAIGMIVVGVLYIQYVTGIVFIVFGCFFLLFALILLLMLFLVRKTFALTAAYFKISAEILGQFHGMILICVLSIGVYLVFAAFWMSSFICTLYYQYPVVIFIGALWMLFSWFWATQVIVGVVRVTVAGVVGHWYYEDQNISGNSVVIASFRRAIFTSFGSICFGALITATLNTIYAFYRFLYAANRNSQANNIGALIAKLIICCFLIVMMVVIDRVRRLMKFFNNYAFTFVAVYGLKYTDAGYATLKLLVTKGLEAVMAAGCVRIVAFAQFCTIGMVSLVVTSSILGLLYAAAVPLDAVVWSASLGLSFAVSVGIGMISTEIVAYCIPAILICTANEPSKMPTKTPELYELLRTKFPLLQVLRDINIV